MAPRFDKLVFDSPKDRPRIRYENAAGVKMELGWREPGTRKSGESSLRLLDGKPIPDITDDTKWPLLKNPRMVQACGDPRMRVRHAGGRETVFDFSRVEGGQAADGRRRNGSR